MCVPDNEVGTADVHGHDRASRRWEAVERTGGVGGIDGRSTTELAARAVLMTGHLVDPHAVSHPRTATTLRISDCTPSASSIEWAPTMSIENRRRASERWGVIVRRYPHRCGVSADQANDRARGTKDSVPSIVR